MKLQVISVFDDAAKAFLPPFFVRSKGEAIRSFCDAVLDEKHQFHRHREDYILYSLGEFDDRDGTITFDSAPTRLLLGVEVEQDNRLPLTNTSPF